MSDIDRIWVRWEAVYATMCERHPGPEFAEHRAGFRTAVDRAIAEETEDVLTEAVRGRVRLLLNDESSRAEYLAACA